MAYSRPIAQDVFPIAFKAFIERAVVPMLPTFIQMATWNLAVASQRNFVEYYAAATIYSLEKTVFNEMAEIPVIFGPLSYDVAFATPFRLMLKDDMIRNTVYHAFRSLKSAYRYAFSKTCRTYSRWFPRIWSFLTMALYELSKCIPPEVELAKPGAFPYVKPMPIETEKKNPPTLTQIARKAHIRAYGMQFMTDIRNAHFEKNIERCFLSHAEAINTIHVRY